jgi:hypothetical protein
MDTTTFNAAFWLTITGVITAFISGALVYAIKSKCTRCSLCFGLIDVQRDTAMEEKIEELALARGFNPYQNIIDGKKASI